MLHNILLILFLSIFLSFCKKKEFSGKNFRFGNEMISSRQDTNDDKKVDTMAYVVNDPDNYRIVYQEMDRNLDGLSDTFIWAGLSSATKKGQKVKDPVKVHEEEDTDLDGKIDTIKWLLPNNFIAMSQEDKDKDGYFETTVYYNFLKNKVRKEVDTNFDGKADRTFWSTRAEVDTNFDGIYDSYIISKSSLALEEKAMKGKDLQDLKREDSWFHNRKLVPERRTLYYRK